MRISLRLFLPLLLLTSACGASKQTQYFQDSQSATGDSAIRMAAAGESVIRPDDILAINVTSVSSIAVEKDPVTIFRSGGTAFSVAASQGVQSPAAAAGGYLVDASGNIDFPVVGKVLVGGLTIEAAKSLLAARLKDYVKSPIVEVRIINYKVTVLGEVRSPGIVLAPNHRINLLEALAAAGDILISGRRDNVQVIRQNGESVRLDLSSREAFRSPYFHLEQNDVVIVDASRVRRTESNDFVRIYLPIITSTLSVLAVTYSIIYSSTRSQ